MDRARSTPPEFWIESHAVSRRLEQLATLFVVGSQKSGTTWVQYLLGAHPEVAVGGEGHYMDLLLPLLTKALETHNNQLKASLKYGTPDLRASLRLLMERTLGRTLAAKSDPDRVRVVGDKTPESAVAMHAHEELFPGSHYVHVIRDGRDCVVSGWAHLQRLQQGSQFASIDDYAEYFATGHWIPYVTRARAAGAGMPGRYLEVRYEALIADPLVEATRLFRFLGVSDSAELVGTCVSEASFESMSGGRMPGVTDPASHIRKGIVGDYQTGLPQSAIARFERCAGSLLDQLGYPRAATTSSCVAA